MAISEYLTTKILDLALRNTSFAPITSVYGSLHTADPGKTGTASPVASCPRVAIAFNAATTATGSINATTFDFSPQSSGVVSHMGLWDSSDTGTANHLWNGALATTKAFNVGDTVRVTSGQLVVRVTT